MPPRRWRLLGYHGSASVSRALDRRVPRHTLEQITSSPSSTWGKHKELGDGLYVATTRGAAWLYGYAAAASLLERVSEAINCPVVDLPSPSIGIDAVYVDEGADWTPLVGIPNSLQYERYPSKEEGFEGGSFDFAVNASELNAESGALPTQYRISYEALTLDRAAGRNPHDKDADRFTGMGFSEQLTGEKTRAALSRIRMDRLTEPSTMKEALKHGDTHGRGDGLTRFPLDLNDDAIKKLAKQPPVRVPVAPDGSCFFNAVAWHTSLTPVQRRTHMEAMFKGQGQPLGADSIGRAAGTAVRRELAEWLAWHVYGTTDLRELRQPGAQKAKVPTSEYGRNLQTTFDMVTDFGKDTAHLRPTLLEYVADLPFSAGEAGGSVVWGDPQLLGGAVTSCFQRPLHVHHGGAAPMVYPFRIPEPSEVRSPLQMLCGAPIVVRFQRDHYDVQLWHGPFA